jgi:hypothetical protein
MSLDVSADPSPFRRFRAVVVAVDDPCAVASDWSRLFGVDIETTGDAARVVLGDAAFEFSFHEGASGIQRLVVDVADVEAVASRAQARGVAVRDHSIPLLEVHGVLLELRADDSRVEIPTRGFTRIKYVAAAVHDEDAALESWHEAFDFEAAPEGLAGVIVDEHIPIGDAWLGLTSSGTDEQSVGRFLQRRGEGVYSVGVVVPDRDAVVARARAGGATVMGDPSSDAQVFVHPSSTGGVLLELGLEWPGGVRRARSPAHG